MSEIQGPRNDAATADNPLDLYDIATLLNYERTTTEPRFRHTKLREFVNPGEESQIKLKTEEWNDNARTILVFDQRPSESNARDLPENMLPTGPLLSPKLENISSKELETIFYRARAHDGCYDSIALLQHFFDLYAPSTKLRIRHIGKSKKKPGVTYITRIEKRAIVAMRLMKPKHSTANIVFDENGEYIAYVSGHEPTMDHAVFAFAREDTPTYSSFLDLASMQFGDDGRGPGEAGQGLFDLGTDDEFEERMYGKFTTNLDPAGHKSSARINPGPRDKWLKEAAERVKERWENREKERWCGHCGCPVPEDKKCAGCKAAWYCCKEHQQRAWPFHKGYCKTV
jgi:hypothetical protein